MRVGSIILQVADMDVEGHEDVSEYLHRRQRDFPLVNIEMTEHGSLTPRMVAHALDWAVEVVAEHKKSNQTFHLSSMYLTRFWCFSKKNNLAQSFF